MKQLARIHPDSTVKSSMTSNAVDEIRVLNEQLTLANEELKITNEELSSYKNQLEDLVSIRTLELRKKEDYLQYKNYLEKLISGTSTRFFNLSPELVDENINLSLKEICQFIGADSAFLAEIVFSEDFYRITHSWNNEKVSWGSQAFAPSPLTDLAWWIDKIRESDHFIIHMQDGIPEDDSWLFFNRLSGAGSLILIPITYQGNLVGFTGCCSVKSSRNWNTDEITLIRVSGETFVNAVKRKISEKILIESERNYREIFNATSEAIFIFDAATSQIIDVNHAALNLFGFDHEENIAALIEDFSRTVLGFNRSLILPNMEKTIADGPLIFEWQAVRKNGENFWTEVSLKSADIGGDTRVLAVIRDITERKRSQDLLMQSEDRFRSIIQYLTDIVWIIDARACILYESPSSWQVLGYPPGYLIGRIGFDIIHPDDMPVVLKELKRVLVNKNDHLPTEFRVKHLKGHWISLEVIANNMLHHRAIKGIIVTGRDVTERNRVETALRISESKFRNIFNHSSDAIVILNSHYVLLEVNAIFLALTGYTLEETRKMKLTEIITDPYLPILVERLAKIYQHEHFPSIECEIMSKTGHVFPAEITSKAIAFEKEHALIAVIRDITERKHMENRILDTIVSTEEREREKFARNLHDELGPLLSSIKMYVNSLASATEKPKHDFILSQLEKILTEVIQSTKELSNDLSPHVLSSYGLLAAIEWFSQQIKPHISVSLESNLKENRYPSTIELSLYRIIKELVNNTLKHTHATLITIKLHLILDSIHLIYSDNGTGFRKDLQDNFESMGMGMSNIISRARLIKATAKFFNNAPHGMSFEMEVPVS